MTHLYPLHIVTATHRPLHLAVTGHWDLGTNAEISFVRQTFDSVLCHYQQEHAAGVVALSGLALGADTLFAEAALALGIPLETCIANSAVLEKYALGAERTQHLELRARSRRIHQLPFTERSPESYLALGHWLVASCDLLVAAWNGQAPAKPGGTGDVVKMALAAGRPVIHIHPAHRTIAQIGPSPPDDFARPGD